MNQLSSLPTWHKVHGNYTLDIYGVENYFLPCLKAFGTEQYLLMYKTEQQAMSALIDHYHEKSEELVVNNTVNVDIDLLYHHPKNAVIYANDTIDDLLVSLDVDNPYVSVLEVTNTGRVVAGNRRLKAIKAVNKKYLERGEERKIPCVPVYVKHYSFPEDELTQLILNNRQRAYTPFLKGMEALMLMEVHRVRGKRLQLISRHGARNEEDEKLLKEREEYKKQIRGTDNAVRSSEIIAKEVGFNSRHSLEDTVSAVSFVQQLNADGQVDLADKVKKVIDLTSSAKKRAELTKVPLEMLDEICDLVIANPTKTNVSKLVEEKQAANKQQEAKKNLQTDDTLQNRVNLALSLKDKPEDNRFTPIELIESGITVFGQVPDLDPCAPFVDKQKPVPAKNSFTIVDNSLTKEWHGIVFTNFPFSKQPEFFKKLDEQISAGHTRQGIIVCESGALFAQKSQEIITKHKMSICLYKGRIEFPKGDLYKLVKEADVGDEQAKTSNRSSTAIVYYGENHSGFVEEFSVHGDCRMSPQLEAVAAPQKNEPVLSSIQWVKEIGADNRDVFSATFADKALLVKQTKEQVYSVSVNGTVVDNTAHSERFAKAFAIACVLDPAALSPF